MNSTVRINKSNSLVVVVVVVEVVVGVVVIRIPVLAISYIRPIRLGILID